MPVIGVDTSMAQWHWTYGQQAVYTIAYLLQYSFQLCQLGFAQLKLLCGAFMGASSFGAQQDMHRILLEDTWRLRYAALPGSHNLPFLDWHTRVSDLVCHVFGGFSAAPVRCTTQYHVNVQSTADRSA